MYLGNNPKHRCECTGLPGKFAEGSARSFCWEGDFVQSPTPENAGFHNLQTHRASFAWPDPHNGVAVLQPEAVATVRADHSKPEIPIGIDAGELQRGGTGLGGAELDRPCALTGAD